MTFVQYVNNIWRYLPNFIHFSAQNMYNSCQYFNKQFLNRCNMVKNGLKCKLLETICLEYCETPNAHRLTLTWVGFDMFSPTPTNNPTINPQELKFYQKKMYGKCCPMWTLNQNLCTQWVDWWFHWIWIWVRFSH